MGFWSELTGFISDPFGTKAANEAKKATTAATVNRREALRLLQEQVGRIEGLGVPFNEETLNSMVAAESERNAAASNREIARSRLRAAASGMGYGGGMDMQQRLSREGMTRRNITSERDIRASTAQSNWQAKQIAEALRGGAVSQIAGVYEDAPVNLMGDSNKKVGPTPTARSGSAALPEGGSGSQFSPQLF